MVSAHDGKPMNTLLTQLQLTATTTDITIISRDCLERGWLPAYATP